MYTVGFVLFLHLKCFLLNNTGASQNVEIYFFFKVMNIYVLTARLLIMDRDNLFSFFFLQAQAVASLQADVPQNLRMDCRMGFE